LEGDVEAKKIAERFARLEEVEFLPGRATDVDRPHDMRTAFKPATQGGKDPCTSLRQLATLASNIPWPGRTPPGESRASTGSKLAETRQHRPQDSLPNTLDALEELSGFSQNPSFP
jgi:hypothetical protein